MAHCMRAPKIDRSVPLVSPYRRSVLAPRWRAVRLRFVSFRPFGPCMRMQSCVVSRWFDFAGRCSTRTLEESHARHKPVLTCCRSANVNCSPLQQARTCEQCMHAAPIDHMMICICSEMFSEPSMHVHAPVRVHPPQRAWRATCHAIMHLAAAASKPAYAAGRHWPARLATTCPPPGPSPHHSHRYLGRPARPRRAPRPTPAAPRGPRVQVQEGHVVAGVVSPVSLARAGPASYIYTRPWLPASLAVSGGRAERKKQAKQIDRFEAARGFTC